MFFKKSLFLVLTVVVFCESAFVDNLGKCDINDGVCQKEMLQTMVRDIAKTGVPELGIPKIDPMNLKNVSVSVLNVIDITLIDGTAKGIKDCVVNKFITRIDDLRSFMELTCDITVKGQYKVFSESPLIKTFLNGDSIHGEGNGKVKIEKLNLKIDLFYSIEKRNGKLYFKCKPEKAKHAYDVKGRMAFFADNLYIGNQESSKLVTDLLNSNWQMLMKTFGDNFMKKAMEFFYLFMHKFFDNVSVDNFITNDLEPYVDKE